MAVKPAVGIDLGTTNSCVAVYRYNRAEIIQNESGNRITPSQVAFADEGRVVGDAAKNQATRNYQNTIYGVKRLIGRRFSDAIVQADIKTWPFKVVQDFNGRPKIQVSCQGETKTFYPEEISAMVLADIKKTAERFLGKKVQDAVITVPAYFNDSQRKATKDAGRIAGLTVRRILNEPTAAALAYGLDKTVKGDNTKQKTVLVFDLGGGTFDVSVLRIYNGEFKVLATAGDTRLGGEDFDNRLVEHFANEFERKNRVNMRGSAKAMKRLKIACEKAKRELSFSTLIHVEVDSLYEGIDLYEKIIQAKFEDLCADYFQQCITIVDNCLKFANVGKSQVDEIVMVGGSTRIPKVQKMVSEFFEGKQLCKQVNPDEAVAEGAAIQAAKICGDPSTKLQDLVVQNVTPLSLGISMNDNEMGIIVPRNSPIPTKKARIFRTRFDNQISICNRVYEGERARASDNHFLGMFTLRDLPARPRGEVKNKVTFIIDEDGTLNATAEHEETGNKECITFTNNGRLSETEVQNMIQQAQQLEEQDNAYRAQSKAKNALLDYAYSMRKRVRIDPGLLNEQDKDWILTEASRQIDWVYANPDATRETYQMRRDQLDFACSPILSMF